MRITFLVSTWTLGRQVFETRYSRAVLLWDKAGALADRIVLQFPDLEVESGSPSEIKFAGRKKGIALILALDRINVNCEMSHVSLAHFQELCSAVLALVAKELRIETLTRIGHRVMFDWRVDSAERAKKLINEICTEMGLGLYALIDQSDVRLGSKVVEEFTVRYGDEKTGILFALRPTTTRFGLEMPGALSWEEKLPSPAHAATVDVDIYTSQLTEIGILHPEELIKSNLKLVETRILSRLRKAP
jgi:hypothetical protein